MEFAMNNVQSKPIKIMHFIHVYYALQTANNA